MNFTKEIVPFKKQSVSIQKKTKVIKDLIKKVFEKNRQANMKKVIGNPVGKNIKKIKKSKKKPCKKPTCKKSSCKKWINL